jgi:hypothetical protein
MPHTLTSAYFRRPSFPPGRPYHSPQFWDGFSVLEQAIFCVPHYLLTLLEFAPVSRAPSARITEDSRKYEVQSTLPT